LPGHAPTATVIEAMKEGASDFVNAPFDETDIELALAKALRYPEGSPMGQAVRESELRGAGD
jgi:FixJ family two-component response regulator